jgi:hypothetical protein
MRNRPLQCVFCGDPATTRDHVPPKGIFLKPRPPNFITVPSCGPCNHGAKVRDEKFRNTIGMRANTSFPEASEFFRNRTLPGLNKNKREKNALLRSMRKVPIFTDSGLYLGQATAGAFDSEAHDRTIERITRGLYFHHYRLPISPHVSMQVTFIRDGSEWPQRLAEAFQKMHFCSVGGENVFEYAHGRVAGMPSVSMWFYRFYAGHVAFAITGLEGIMPSANHC